MAQAKVDVTVIQRSDISGQTPKANSTDPKSGQMSQGGTATPGNAQMGSPVAIITDWASI